MRFARSIWRSCKQYDANKGIDLEYSDSVLDVRFALTKAVHPDPIDLSTVNGGFDLAAIPGIGSLLPEG